MIPPNLPIAPQEYNPDWQNKFINILRLFFNTVANPGAQRATTLNLNPRTLPTEADIGLLQSGDVYVDTTGGQNILKIKI